MRRRRGIGSAIVGLTLGLLLGFFILNYRLITWKTSIIRNSGSTGIGDSEEKMLAYGREESASLPDGGEIAQTDNLVFVGVMTANKYLGTRAKAVYETWGKNVPGKIEFFSSAYSILPENCPDLPLVALPGVDDGYPPQKKSFLMLQYMWKNYGNRFEWFLRADDDVYVRTDRLEKLLRSVDSRKPMYIGQAGRGNTEEFGLLSLEYDENFCMGGPGVIISRETLKRIVPHIKYCLKNLYTTHEDVELGRCVQKYAGIPCTWSYEMQSILYHNSSGDDAFTGNLKRKEVHRAITLHPVKSSPHMYRLHNYIRGLKIQHLQQERLRLHRDVNSMGKELGMSVGDFIKRPLAKYVYLFPNNTNSRYTPGDTETLGVPAGLRSFEPRNGKEVLVWDFYTRSEYSLGDSNPRRRIHSDVKEGLEDITRQVMASINSCSRQRGRIVEERSALYGYRRVDAYGADTILDLLLVYRKYRGRKVTLPVRRHVYLHQHFTDLEIREVVDFEEIDQDERRRNRAKSGLSSIFSSSLLTFRSPYTFDNPASDKIITFILPLSGRHSIFQRFLKNYEQVCLLTKQLARLIVVLYRSNNGINSQIDDNEHSLYDNTVSLINAMRTKYGNDKIKLLQAEGQFSRAPALESGIEQSSENDLLFFIDVDIVFTVSALNRIRLNTVRNKRIYFPVVFSQFDRKIVSARNVDSTKNVNFIINEKTGYWRQFGFGIVAIYKSDYREIGGFNLSINGWGKEDVDLYEKAVKSENLQVFRAPDKNLIHVYHDVNCDVKLQGSQFSMCQGTRADTYADTLTLAKIIYDNPNYTKLVKSQRLTNTLA